MTTAAVSCRASTSNAVVLLLRDVFEVLDGALELALAGGGGEGEVCDDLSTRLLSGQFLQLCEGLGLSCCCKADDKLSVDPPPLLSGQIQLLQQSQAGADSLLANDLFHFRS